MPLNIQDISDDKKRVLLNDTAYDTAYKIYTFFVVNQSCNVRGMVLVDDEPVPKGEIVLKELQALDTFDNVNSLNRRKRVKPANSIGDYVAQKMFIWEMRIQDKKPIYTIWRKQ